mgnify:CR=1 FL=1
MLSAVLSVIYVLSDALRIYPIGSESASMLDYRNRGCSRKRASISVLKIPIHLLLKNSAFFLANLVIVVLVVARIVGAARNRNRGIIQFNSRHLDSVVESVDIYQVS